MSRGVNLAIYKAAGVLPDEEAAALRDAILASPAKGNRGEALHVDLPAAQLRALASPAVRAVVEHLPSLRAPFPALPVDAKAEVVNVLRYPPGRGCPLHVDTDGPDDEVLAFVVLGRFEGGAVHVGETAPARFVGSEYEAARWLPRDVARPEHNSILAYDASRPHRVSPVTSGTRVVVTVGFWPSEGRQ